MAAQQINIELPEWAECLWQPSRHKALKGGRGGAKSRSVATALVLQAAEHHERVLCGREVQRSIKDSVKRLLDDEIDRLACAVSTARPKQRSAVHTTRLFIFAGLRGNAAGIKSLEGVTKAWVEEAQAISQGSIETLIPTIRTEGSELWWTWNPDLETDPVDAMFCGPEGPPPDTILRHINYTENPWFPDVLRREMEWDRSRDIDKYNHIWLGQYRRNSEARVFKNWRVETFDSPQNVEYRLGADFGFSIDPSAAVRCWIDGTQLFVDHEAWGLGVEIVNLPHLFMSIPDAEKYWMTADSSRPETISHLRNNGFPRIQSAVKGARSLEEGVEWLKSYDIVVHPRCQHLIDELTLYSYKVDSLTGQVTAVLDDKDNHLIDALRYATEGARRAKSAKPAAPVAATRNDARAADADWICAHRLALTKSPPHFAPAPALSAVKQAG
jgi:phage terminase large subunit